MMFMSELQPSGTFEWTQAAGVRGLVCRPLAQYAPHLFTTRDLQLGENDPAWSDVARAVGVDASRLRLIRQVHGSDVAIVHRGEDGAWARPEADAVATDDRSVALGVRVADCAPILLADTVRGAVAAVHAGWRGTAKGAPRAAVDALRQHFGSDPRDLVAAIGPCLGRCCGEVGTDVVETFRAAGHAAREIARWFSPGAADRLMLDLAGANRDQLVAAGVPGDRIHDAGICTKTHAALFHSYRADGRAAGRMVGVIRSASLAQQAL
jgi:YfiH family protein